MLPFTHRPLLRKPPPLVSPGGGFFMVAERNERIACYLYGSSLSLGEPPGPGDSRALFLIVFWEGAATARQAAFVVFRRRPLGRTPSGARPKSVV